MYLIRKLCILHIFEYYKRSYVCMSEEVCASVKKTYHACTMYIYIYMYPVILYTL